MDVGKKITELKDLKGYTTNKLANMAGISQSFLREIEAGNSQPTVETMQYLCDALNVSIKDFFDESQDLNIEDKLFNDQILKEISRLTPDQKNTLLEFLKNL